MYRPSRTGDDRVKMAGLISTATLLHTSTNYSDTADTDYEIVAEDPDVLNADIDRGLRRAWQWWSTPVTLVTDGDFEASGTTNWTASATETVTKVTTAANTWRGASGLSVNNNGVANGYAESDTINVPSGKSVWLCVWGKSSSGTIRCRLWDKTNNQLLDASATVSTTEKDWTLLIIQTTIPSNCYQVAVRLGGDESTAIGIWDDCTLVWTPLTNMVIPSWVDEFRTDNQREAVNLYRLPARFQGGTGTYPGRAYNVERIPPNEYKINNSPSAANPNTIDFLDPAAMLYSLPIIIEARRTYYDFGALSAETTESDCPLALGALAALVEFGMRRNLPETKQWLADYEKEQARAQPLGAAHASFSKGMMGWQVLH